MVQLAVVLRAPGASDGSVVFSQELLVELAGQDAQDLDRVVRVVFMRRLCRHGSILPQLTDIASGRRYVCRPALRSCTKACHVAADMSSLEPSEFFESRIATKSGRLVATSTQLPELPE